jgi:small multidrug resistance pump
MKYWLLLFIAILLEATGTTFMKLSRGFRNPVATVFMFVCYLVGLVPLNLALRHIDLSVAYAVWSGLGTVFITVVGILYFREPATAIRLVSIGLIIIGVIGLNLSGGVH